MLDEWFCIRSEVVKILGVRLFVPRLEMRADHLDNVFLDSEVSMPNPPELAFVDSTGNLAALITEREFQPGRYVFLRIHKCDSGGNRAVGLPVAQIRDRAGGVCCEVDCRRRRGDGGRSGCGYSGRRGRFYGAKSDVRVHVHAGDKGAKNMIVGAG